MQKVSTYILFKKTSYGLVIELGCRQANYPISMLSLLYISFD